MTQLWDTIEGDYREAYQRWHKQFKDIEVTNYIIDKEKLKEILLAHKTFVSQRIMKLKESGVDITRITYRESEKFTDEFIETMINKLPLDNLLDKVDEALIKTTGKSSKDFMP